MKHIVKSIFLLTAAASFTLSSCTKKPDPNNNNTETDGELGIEIHNYAGATELKLDSSYSVPGGQTLMINKFNYYISNIKLKKADGTEFAEKESYHLITADKKSSGHLHMDVPAGSYTSVSFLIGVDSTRNVSGAQTGALDPANGMFWTWNTGYIMAKLEGSSPQSGETNKKITLHVGGFSGANSGIRPVTLTFAQPITIEAGKEKSITLKADALAWFSPNQINFSEVHTLMGANANSKKIADNYAGMISIMN